MPPRPERFVCKLVCNIISAYLRLGPFIEKLEALLAENAARGRWERLTLMRVHEGLGVKFPGPPRHWTAARRLLQDTGRPERTKTCT